MNFTVLISPALQMRSSDEVPLPAHAPQFLHEAQELALHMTKLSLEDAQSMWKCSPKLAQASYEQLTNLIPSLSAAKKGHLSALTSAIVSFSGIQYTYLAAQVLTADSLAWLDSHLRIGSGLFGLLRPLDAVIPYRLEMQNKLEGIPHGSLYEFWGDSLAQALLAQAPTCVMCCSAEYARAVASHAQTLGLKTVEVQFLAPTAKGALAQRAPECKIARGSFVRWAAEQRIDCLEELLSWRDRSYEWDGVAPDFSASQTIVRFIRKSPSV